MPAGYPQPVFLDATVISNYASTNSIEFLVDVLEAPVVTPAVRDEIEQGVEFGHEYLTSAVEAFDDELTVSDVPPETGRMSLGKRLDPARQKRCGEPLNATERSPLMTSQHAVSPRN
jgi:hypothetical protein